MTALTVFCGCSYTEGIGLDEEILNSNLWTNIVHATLLPETKLVNIAKSGSTNEDILLSALDALYSQSDCKYLFVAWTNPKRLHIWPGVETYNTKLYLESSKIPDLPLHPGTVILGSYVENIRDRFFDLSHHHYDLVKILRYTNTIAGLAQRMGVRAFFVNALMHVAKNYFNPVVDPDRRPSDTPQQTQKLLHADTRDDKEYFQIYDQTHKDYAQTGGLNAAWLNLDQGMRTAFYLDRGNDNLHPGPISNQTFAQFCIKKLQSLQVSTNYNG